MFEEEREPIRQVQELKKQKALFPKTKILSEEGMQIIREIEKIKCQLESSKLNFDLATDDSLIDSYIYEIISLNKKYQYFLKIAKDMGLVAAGFEKIG